MGALEEAAHDDAVVLGDEVLDHEAQVREASEQREQRAQATRRRIRDAASRLFLRDGYAATTMSAIAREAEVGERTVYLAFPTTPALLGEIITVAVRGGDEDAPLAARDAWQQVLAAPADEILPRLADAVEAILARTAPVLAVAEAAAASSPELAARREAGQRNMRSDYREVADALARAGALADTVTPQSPPTRSTRWPGTTSTCGSRASAAGPARATRRGSPTRSRPR
ncbi:MAG: TetR/AcrR family transcriptional regulator [Solirubrobacteraceae bacterium]